MKTIKMALAGIILLFAGLAASAASKPSSAHHLTKDEVVNMYIDAVTHGQMKGLDEILDDSLHYNINRGSMVKTMSKNELESYLRSNPVDPSVKTVTTPMAFDDEKAVVRVAFEYGGLTRTETLTLVNEGDWIITNIDTKFSGS